MSVTSHKSSLTKGGHIPSLPPGSPGLSLRRSCSNAVSAMQGGGSCCSHTAESLPAGQRHGSELHSGGLGQAERA